jgi:uncharacterized protein DUF4760
MRREVTATHLGWFACGMGIVGLMVWLSGLSIKTLQDAALVAPLATAVIALAAALVALSSMFVQRDTARRRAAIDFFLKTEMDDDIVKSYDRFLELTSDIPALISNPNIEPNDPELRELRKWLNICELIAVGVNLGAFSEKVSLDYWGDVLPDTFRESELFIKFLRRNPEFGTPHTYLELERLAERWRGVS